LPVSSLSILFTLYFSQGLPSGILAHTLPALMSDQGVPLEYIGLIKLLALPWALKFLWAPYVDRYGLAQWGQNKTWIVGAQFLLACLFFCISFSTPESLFGVYLILFMVGIVLVNTTAATQDVATDGLAVKLLPERWRGLGNSVQVAGFKAGMILSGSLLLLGIDHFGWSASFTILALLLILLLFPVLYLKTAALDLSKTTPSSASPFKIYYEFFQNGQVLSWLPVLITYKIADSLGSAMIKPLLVDQGYTLTGLASLTFWSSLFGLLGAALAGWAYYYLGQKKMLIGACVLQALGIAAYACIANGLNSVEWVYAISLFEQAADGISTVALFSLMMAQCRVGHEGADFTVQASIQVFVSGLAGALSGVIAASLGFSIFFFLVGFIGLLALLPALRYFKLQAQTKHNY